MQLGARDLALHLAVGAPFRFRFERYTTAVITGVLVILTEMVTLSVYRAWEEWFNVLLGIWLLAAPWILGITILAAMANFIVVGLLVLMLAIYEIWRGGSDVRGTKRSFTPASVQTLQGM